MGHRKLQVIQSQIYKIFEDLTALKWALIKGIKHAQDMILILASVNFVAVRALAAKFRVFVNRNKWFAETSTKGIGFFSKFAFIRLATLPIRTAHLGGFSGFRAVLIFVVINPS